MTGSIRNLAVGLPGAAISSSHRSVRIASQASRSVARSVGALISVSEPADAVVREFREELDVTVAPTALLGVIENLFEFEGQPGHEIVHVFALESAELDRVGLDASLSVLDAGNPVSWYAISDLRAGHPPLYPMGILDLL